MAAKKSKVCTKCGTTDLVIRICFTCSTMLYSNFKLHVFPYSGPGIRVWTTKTLLPDPFSPYKKVVFNKLVPKCLPIYVPNTLYIRYSAYVSYKRHACDRPEPKIIFISVILDFSEYFAVAVVEMWVLVLTGFRRLLSPCQTSQFKKKTARSWPLFCFINNKRGICLIVSGYSFASTPVVEFAISPDGRL